MTVDDINGEPVVIAEPIRVHCMDAIMYLDDTTPSGKAAVEFWQDCFLLAILSFNKNEGNLYQQSAILEEYPVRYGFRADLSY